MEKSNLATLDKTAPEPSKCAACKFSATVKSAAIGAPDELQCRRYPPSAQPVFGAGPDGRPRMMGTFTYFPIATALCGEYVPLPGAAVNDVRIGDAA